MARAYWIGALPSYFAYLVTQPLELGGVGTLEIIRGWVDAGERSKGLFSALLRQASGADLPLVADREGITEVAHVALKRARGFTHSYFDIQREQFVPTDEVPEDERFCAFSNGKRWLLTLTPVALPNVLKSVLPGGSHS